MSNPTHRHKTTGALVFPDGYRPASIEILPEGFWAEQNLIAAWPALRTERDRRLLLSDHEVMPDRPLSEVSRAAWNIYRQALRALPDNTADPVNPAWPALPTENI